VRRGKLDCPVIGVAKSGWSRDQLLERARASVTEYGGLDAAAFPDIAFKSTRVRLTGDREAAVTGDLTLHGVTKQVTLRARYNGGYAGHPLDPGA